MCQPEFLLARGAVTEGEDALPSGNRRAAYNLISNVLWAVAFSTGTAMVLTSNFCAKLKLG